MAQRLKRLPAMQETWVRSLGREDPLEREMATHSSTLAWRIPWTEELGRLQSTGSQSRTRLSDFTHSLCNKGHAVWISEDYCPQKFGTLLCVGRCESWVSLKLFLWYRSQLFGASFLCFHILSFLRAPGSHGDCNCGWLSHTCLLIWQEIVSFSN